MEYAVELERLSKRYGTKQALEQLSIRVPVGSCYGLLGPNGAGKSTTMKILSGLFDPDEGVVRVFGKQKQQHAQAIKQTIGYVPQSITLYEKLTAQENLLFFGEMYGVKGELLRKRIQHVLEQVGLIDRAIEPVSQFSGGMKRRINIAAALLHEPRLLVLDEPTVGIDPQSRNHIFEMIRQLRADGVTVLYSTHYMEEVETLCDALAIVDHGRVIAEGLLDHVLDTHGTSAVYVESEALREQPSFAGLPACSAHSRGWLYETDLPLDTIAKLAAACQQQRIPVKQLEIVRPSLERVFLSLTGTTLRDT